MAYLNLVWFAPLFVCIFQLFGRYRCPQKRAVRLKLAQLLAAHPRRPLLICANHLTMIDSMLITWLLFDMRTLLRHFHHFPWNVPELQNFGRNPLLRLMCYLGKCVYVERNGTTAAKRLSWAKINYLFAEGETICIFPEGGRSREGRIARESAVYGVGQLVQDHPHTLVLAVYLRGLQQEQHSFFPRRGETFALDFERCDCPLEAGRRGQRAATLHIIDQLEALEARYFANRQ